MKIDWQIAGKRGQIKSVAEGAEQETIEAVEKAKASVRTFIEHPFHIVKHLFDIGKCGVGGWPRTGPETPYAFAMANVVIGGHTATA